MASAIRLALPAILLLLALSSLALGGVCDLPGTCLEKAAGEEVRFVVDLPGTWNIYIRTGIGAAATKLPVTLTDVQKVYFWKMPNSTTQEYRFDAIPVELGPTGTVLRRGPAINEILVTRRKK